MVNNSANKPPSKIILALDGLYKATENYLVNDIDSFYPFLCAFESLDKEEIPKGNIHEKSVPTEKIANMTWVNVFIVYP